MDESPAPMGTVEILEAAIRLYMRRFPTFVAVAAVAYVPSAFLLALASALLHPYSPEPYELPDVNPFDVSADHPAIGYLGVAARFGLASARATALPLLTMLFLTLVRALSAVFLTSMAYALAMSALVVNISAGFTGEELGALESYARVFGKLGRLFTAQFLATVRVVLGFLFFVVPGIIACLRYMVLPAVALLEDQGPTTTLRRCRTLLSGNLGRAFVLAVALLILTIAADAATSRVLAAVPLPTRFVREFCENFLGALTLPLSTSAMVLFYYDLRARKEGFRLAPLGASREGFTGA